MTPFIPIIAVLIAGTISWFIYITTRRYNAIKEFKEFFLSERHKIITTKAAQDISLQGNSIRKLDGIISAGDIAAIRNLWEDYKKAENQCRQAVSPGNGSVYFHYGDHSPKILTKIDKIINYLK